MLRERKNRIVKPSRRHPASEQPHRLGRLIDRTRKVPVLRVVRLLRRFDFANGFDAEQESLPVAKARREGF